MSGDPCSYVYYDSYSPEGFTEPTCDCFLYEMHDNKNCLMGKVHFASNYGLSDAHLLMYGMCAVMTLVVCFTRNPRAKRGERSCMAGFMRHSMPHQSLLGKGIVGMIWLCLVVCTTGRILFVAAAMPLARDLNIALSTTFNVSSGLLVVFLQAAWYRSRDSGARKAPLYPGKSLLAIRTFTDIRMNESTLRRGLTFAGGLSCLVALLYPVSSYILAGTATIVEDDDIGHIVPASNWLIHFFVVGTYCFQIVALVYSFDFMTLQAIDRHVGIEGSKPSRYRIKLEQRNFTLMTLINLLLVVRSVVIMMAYGRYCPYIAFDKGRGDPYETPIVDISNFLIFAFAFLVLFWSRFTPSELDETTLTERKRLRYLFDSPTHEIYADRLYTLVVAIISILFLVYDFQTRDPAKIGMRLLVFAGFFISLALITNRQTAAHATRPMARKWSSQTIDKNVPRRKGERWRATISLLLYFFLVLFYIMVCVGAKNYVYGFGPAMLWIYNKIFLHFARYPNVKTSQEIGHASESARSSVVYTLTEDSDDKESASEAPALKRGSGATVKGDALSTSKPHAESTQHSSFASLYPRSTWAWMVSDFSQFIRLILIMWVVNLLLLSGFLIVAIMSLWIYVGGSLVDRYLPDDTPSAIEVEGDKEVADSFSGMESPVWPPPRESFTLDGTEPSAIFTEDLPRDAQEKSCLQLPWVRTTIDVSVTLLAIAATFAVMFLPYLLCNPLPHNQGQIMVIGHRGVWMDDVPENSFASVDKAKEFGFHGVEFDVRLTKDKQMVVMHDDTLDRTTNGHGSVGDWTLPELKTLQLKDSNETVPTLDEYLAYVKEQDLIANVEVKQGYDDRRIGLALDAICRHDMTEKTFISTGEMKFQNALQRLQPDVSLEKDFLYYVPLNSLLVPENANIIAISGELLFLNTWIIPPVHNANKMVLVYFLFTECAFFIDLYVALGVDGFMFNNGKHSNAAGETPPAKDYELARTINECKCTGPNDTSITT